MDTDEGAKARNPSEEGIRETDGGCIVVDSNVKHKRGGHKPSSPCEVGLTVDRGEMSLSQEATSAEGDGMDIDSENTYSCRNASSDNGVDSSDDHEFTSQNGSSVENSGLNNNTDGRNEDRSPGICSVNQLRINVDDTHAFQTPEGPSTATSGSVSGTKDESPEYLVPKLGVEFESEDHAYKCYNRYALMEGFSIRKDFVNRSKITGLVVSRRYTCYRQGYGSTKRDAKANKARKDTRTGCLAHMTITRQPNGKYRVIHFETKHNHEFATSVTAHLLPSQKRISFVEAIESGSAGGNSVVDGVPKLGMGFDSEDHAYEFYNAYAARLGFSVRKDYVNRSKVDGAVASRRYTCFREGFRQKDKRGLKVKRPRKETRVGCMAQLVVSRQADGKYRVTQFEENHNHELVPSCKVRMLRSQKRFATNQAVESCVLEGSNLQPKKLGVTNLLRGEGAQGAFSYDPIDHEAGLPSKRSRRIVLEEAQRIHQYFQNKQLKDPSFFCAIQLDAEEQMTNFFWADEKMMMDYADFGDVVCFDTMYYLNKEWRPLALFLGLNNHKHMLVYGAAFLYDDTSESFKWLFRTFTKAVSGKKPKTILSYQEAAISEAVIAEYPDTSHRYCIWHQYQSALVRLREVTLRSNSFANDLCGCIFNQDEEDFVNSWKIMLDAYGLWGNEWLHEKFEGREKWALPYGKHIFSADIETCRLYEDSTASLEKYLKLESHVVQFFKHFGRMVNDWRFRELEANYEMGQHMPRVLGDIIMLQQARDVYTPNIFELFQHEYENCLNIIVNQRVDGATSSEYKVSTYGQLRQYTVIYCSGNDSVACSCMKFQSIGILCSHALKVLDYCNIKVVPSRYILKRWSRDARA